MHTPSHANASAQRLYRVEELGTSPSDVDAWQDYVTNRQAATIYHDLAWREIFGTLRYSSHMLVAKDDAGQIGGVVPLYKVPSLGGKARLVAVPFRDRGGAVFDDAEAFSALVAAAEQLRVESGAAHVVFKTTDPYPANETDAAGLARVDHWVHSETDLAQLDPDTLQRRLGDKTRNMIRQAEQAGLRVSEVEPHLHLDDWMQVYRRSQHALGLPAFPRRFFERLFLTLGHDGRARLFLVTDSGGTAVAASIMLLEHARAIYGYSASTRHGRDARANDLMLAHLLQWALAHRLQHFDFGSDSPLQSGLLFFKRKWLARQTAIPTYYLGGTPSSQIDSSSSQYGTVRWLVRHLPERVSRLGLTPLVRYFG